MKKLFVITSTLIFLLIAFWLGEAGMGLFQLSPYLMGLIGVLSTIFIFSKWKHRAVYVFFFFVLYAGAFYAGDCSFYQAYNTCYQEAESIRNDLSNYKNKNGKYPDKLKDLNKPLPCLRCIRGTILEYEATASSYKILFKDWLVEHSATDREPFTAHK
ncbi:MAG: hypothetical protein U9R43_00395 [Thermodesulfobacteriota bacterium]|nr:hypothetical protein [Thermodesulfobacteriota bacterium]